MDIIQKIQKANLTGRGGAGFPTAKKWEMVRDAEGDKKYVIANGSEGEPGVFKDSYIIEKYPEKIVKGVMIAMQTIGADEGYIYLREDLFHTHKKKLKLIVNEELKSKNGNKSPQEESFKIHIFREDGKYLNGEETTMINSIEKKRSEPRFKPPYPTTCGLWQCPTLVNNVETFYRISQIAENKYKNKRFYSLSGKVKHTGVFELDADLTIEEVLRQTDNLMSNDELRITNENKLQVASCKFQDLETPLRGQGGVDFFVQAGGGAHGNIFTKEECKREILRGAGALVVHTYDEDLVGILKEWTKFFLVRNCGQCIPCREGFYRINQLLRAKEIDYDLIKEILEVMADASFCALGQFAPEGYFDFMKKILKV